MEIHEAIEIIRTSVVQISATVVAGTEADRARLHGKNFLSRPLGTGFFVSEEAHVLTAQHVVDGARRVISEWPQSQVQIGIGLAVPNSENMRANFHIVGFDVVEEDDRHDIALLKLSQNPFEGEIPPMIVINGESIGAMYGVPMLQTTRPRDGEPIAVSGYPLGETVLVTNAGIVASSWSVTRAEVAHPTVPDVTLPDLRDTYLADVQTNPGNSGGPAYSTLDGAVIGVLVAGRLTEVTAGDQPVAVNGLPVLADAGLSLLVPIKYAVEMLERHRVAWLTAGA